MGCVSDWLTNIWLPKVDIRYTYFIILCQLMSIGANPPKMFWEHFKKIKVRCAMLAHLRQYWSLTTVPACLPTLYTTFSILLLLCNFGPGVISYYCMTCSYFYCILCCNLQYVTPVCTYTTAACLSAVSDSFQLQQSLLTN